MANKFDIDIHELYYSGHNIIDIANEWVKEVDSIYAAINELSVSYQGEANSQFIHNIYEYQNDFIAAHEALDCYISFLFGYSREMYESERYLKDQLNQLPIAKSPNNQLFGVDEMSLIFITGHYFRNFAFSQDYYMSKSIKEFFENEKL